ncbi:MAG: hypothetical protein LDLANPLL_00171 [Turneriella sp.]|nr:hypothetical protein [Turneriella sp.]
MLEFNTAFEKDVLVIELEGALDSHSAADFRAWFNEKIRAGFRAVALDCLCLEYISSAGISALIDLQNLLTTQKGKLVLFQLSSETRQLLRFLQLEAKLNITQDYEDAIAALTGIAKASPAANVESSTTKVVERERAMVTPEELHIIAKKENTATTENRVVASATTTVEAPTKSDELIIEEKASTPIGSTLAKAKLEPKEELQEETTPSIPDAPVIKEAQEIKISTASRKLITCPNCRSVLRLAVAGDYLCPACRFRFTYKGSKEEA